MRDVGLLQQCNALSEENTEKIRLINKAFCCGVNNSRTLVVYVKVKAPVDQKYRAKSALLVTSSFGYTLMILLMYTTTKNIRRAQETDQCFSYVHRQGDATKCLERIERVSCDPVVHIELLYSVQKTLLVYGYFHMHICVILLNIQLFKNEWVFIVTLYNKVNYALIILFVRSCNICFLMKCVITSKIKRSA